MKNFRKNNKMISLESFSTYKRYMISKHIKFLGLLGLILMSTITDLAATHIVGGNMTYRHIEGERYEIRLTMRRDCFNGASDAQFDNPATVWIFNGDGELQTDIGVSGKLKLNFNPDDTLDNIVISDCGFEGTQVCVHETTYRETVRLPFNPGEDGYIFAYQRCCRNGTLENVLDPLETGGTWMTHITEEALMSQNSSPQFVQWPAVYICANDNLQFDHSATDADGDSLVYKICTPFDGASPDTSIVTINPPFPPYDNIDWRDPYDLNNLLGGDPLQIDIATGELTGNPPLVGQFLVGICVEEYRNGVKIGEVIRDFQYNVRVCSDPPTALFEANGGDCNGPEIQIDNQSLGGSNYQWNFNFPSTDPAFMSNEENPLFVYDEPGVYNVQLIVTRGTDDCRDELVQQVAALFTDIEVDYDLTIEDCNEDGGYTIELNNTSVEPEEGFDIIGAEWTITQGGSGFTLNGNSIEVDISNEELIVELQVESETGCKKTRIDTIDIADFMHVADFVFELNGCPTGELPQLALGDISDSLNVFDSPQGYAWTVATSLGEVTGMDSSLIVEVTDSEIISVELTVDFGGGCSAVVAKDIDLSELTPQASYQLEANGCPDDGTVDITLTNTSNGSAGYTLEGTAWMLNVAGQSFDGTDSVISVNIPKDSLLSIELISLFNNGCFDSVVEEFVPGPFATIEFTLDSLIVCLGDTVPVVVNPNSDFEYTWSTTDGLYFEDNSDLSNPGVIGIQDTEYFVTVSDGLCSVESSFEVTVLDAENLSISGDSITCDGDVLLTAAGGFGEGVFQWSTTSEFTEIIFEGEVLDTSFVGQEQTYYVRFTGESCNDPFASYRVILSDIFDLEFNGDPVRVCIGDTVPLLSNPNSLLTYVWTPIEGLVFTVPGDSSSASVIGIKDTTYNLTISDDFCTKDTIVNVVVADAQAFEILGDSIVCTDTVQLVATGAVGLGEYQWSLDEDFSSILSVGDTLNTLLTDLSTTYFVQYTDTTCGDLVLSYEVRKFVFDLEYFDVFMMCPGDTIDYTVFNSGEGPLTYEWVEDVHIVEGQNSNMITIGIAPGETEDFELYLKTTSPTGCMQFDTVLIDVMQNPGVDFTFELQECGDFTVCFDIIGEYNGFPSWDFGDPNVTTDTSLDTMPCYTYDMPGTYDVVLSNLTSFCPFDSIVKTVTVNGDISIDPIEDQIVCADSIVSLTATSSDFNVSFVWCDINGDTIVVGADYEELVTESYQVIVKAEDVNGCTDQDTINIGPFIFNIEDNISEVFCDSEFTDVEVLVNGTQEGYTFEWGPEECIVSGGDTGNPVLIAGGDKEFSVTITYDELGCQIVKDYQISTTSFDIELSAEPDTIINQTEEVTIFVVDALEEYTYEWNDGSTDEELVDAPEESQWYSVTVTDAMGCTAVDSIFITVRLPECDETDVFLPTAFTPNGDNNNDVLFVRSNFIESMELLIYNRWGEEVFRSVDQGTGWDGTYKGEEVQPDAFAYTLRVICINQEEFIKRGNVNLIK